MDLDFKIIEGSHTMITECDEKLKKICNFLKNRVTIHDTEIKTVVSSLEADQEEKDKNGFYLKVLWSIHYCLFPTKKFPRKDVNGKTDFGKFSMKNSQESFILISETHQSLLAHIDFLVEKGEPIQPFILGLGDPKTLRVEKFFVYLDSVMIEFNEFCRALDICFKSFHIFNVEYPLASSNFWCFIEHYLYNIEKTNFRKSTKVSVLISEISSN